MNYKYSIIIPHYNSFDRLCFLLKSIPIRSDIQICVIDDKSDNEIIDQLKSISRIGLNVIFLEENIGGGGARNKGLEIAKGKWIIFADADDFFMPRAFDIFDNFYNSSFDYICYCCCSYNIETSSWGGRNITSDKSVRKYLSNSSYINHFKYRNFACWNKIYSLDFLIKNKIKFEESTVNNDVYFSFQVAYYATSFKVLNDELYCCTFSNNSLTYKKRNKEREFLFYIQAKKRNGFYNKIGLGYPFYRYDFIYLPYIIYKRGFKEAFEFYKYSWIHRSELVSAEKAYLDIFNHEK